VATPDHTPHGRGYQSGLHYFHHDNDYWSMAYQLRCNGTAMTDLWHTPVYSSTGFGVPACGFNNTCTTEQPAGAEQPACRPGPYGDHWWGGYEDALLEQAVLDGIRGHHQQQQQQQRRQQVAECKPRVGVCCMGLASQRLHGLDAQACCAACAADESGLCGTWQVQPQGKDGAMTCDLKAQGAPSKPGNCTSGSLLRPPTPPAPAPAPSPPADCKALTSRGSCDDQGGCQWKCGKSRPGEEEAAEAARVLSGAAAAVAGGGGCSCQAGTIPPPTGTGPLFLMWAPHIVHAPLQAPQKFLDDFDFIKSTDQVGAKRQTYHAMVKFADAAIGNVTALLHSTGMWDDTLIVFSGE
jgi:hypothetical protein